MLVLGIQTPGSVTASPTSTLQEAGAVYIALVVEQPGKLTVTVWLVPSEIRLLKTVVKLVVVGLVRSVCSWPPSLTVNVPVVGLVRLMTTVEEKLLVSEAHRPAVATALMEQTGAMEQEDGAV